MADKKISDFTAETSAADGDLSELETAGGNSRKITIANLRASLTPWRLVGTGQTATGVWDFAVDGAKANIDFAGLAGASDIMLVCKLVTQSIAGVSLLQVSTDNGSSYYAGASDYQTVSSAGVEGNSATSTGLIDTTATAARSWGVIVMGANTAAPKLIQSLVRYSSGTAYFSASASAINAVRLGKTGGGTFNGGKVYCYIR